MSATQDANGGPQPPDGYSVFDHHLGPVTVAFNRRGVSAVDLFDDGFGDRFEARFQRAVVETTPPSDWAELIRRSLEVGQPLGLPIDFSSVTALQKQILIRTAAIPQGQTRSYGWVAAQVGRPKAARVVGRAMASNPVPLIVPCHRVVRSDGQIGHYGLGGEDNKRKLLRTERAIE